jgi:hypothetical protein
MRTTDVLLVLAGHDLNVDVAETERTYRWQGRAALPVKIEKSLIGVIGQVRRDRRTQCCQFPLRTPLLRQCRHRSGSL